MEQILQNVPKFLVIFLRTGACFTAVPFFNNSAFAMPVKLAFALFIALVLLPGLSSAGWAIPADLPSFVSFMIQEFLVGMAIGFVVLVLVLALEMIGHLLGFQMAFSMATAFDPTFGSTNNILSIFLAMLATWMFLLLGGDHYVLQALHSSFTLLPPGHIVVRRGLLTLFSRLLTGAFAIGFQLAAPVIILLLAVDAVLGLISKTAARMQIFFVGLPLKIAVGLFAFTAILGLVRLVWGGLVMRLPGNLLDMFRLMVR